MPNTIRLDDTQTVNGHDRSLVGGKGKHLMLTLSGGFPVPPGYTVTTEAYDLYVEHNGLADYLVKVAKDFDYGDPVRLEEQAGEVRARILDGETPAELLSDIEREYSRLNGFVAVRSSGTAEDMADASFAGLHDTYLDINGVDALHDAIKRCWASLWTARAVSYRGTEGHIVLPKLAVVVQTMIDADAAGVMFTANPLSTATDEIVVNANWGLGESIVSGIANPDQFTLTKAKLEIMERTLGDKKVMIVRNPQTQVSTVELETPTDKQASFSLDDAALVDLGLLGRRIEEHFDGLPQDIEWAVQDGELFILQSRAITGVDFTWDSDVDAWQEADDEPDAIWTRKFADEFWTGPITPLFYSVRARGFTDAGVRSAEDWGFPDVGQKRRHKYYKAEVYTNSNYQKALVSHALPKKLREGSLAWLNSEDQKNAESWDFSWKEYARMLSRIQFMTQNGLQGWFDEACNYDLAGVPEGGELNREKLTYWADDAVVKLIDQYTDYAENKHYSQWTGWFVHVANAMTAFGKILASWYDGDNPAIFVDLITGLPERTSTMQENIDLWRLSAEIRSNPTVRKVFDDSAESDFFRNLESVPEGAKALEMYGKILEDHGHRGHADRDFYFARRLDDPALDYRLLKALLSGDGNFDPEAEEEKLRERHRAAVEDVTSRLRDQPMGAARVAAFNAVYKYVVRFMLHRDNQRHHLDRVTYGKKLAFSEVGRRMAERQQLQNADDFYFLSEDELITLFRSGGRSALAQAKIRGRRRAFDQYVSGEYTPPVFMKDGREWVDPAEAQVVDDSSGSLQGFGTSRGTYTGRARVITSLADIGRVEEGDILVTNSTDPAWTPVFLVIGGLVLETGGLLAHGACLSREYNLPSVTVANAVTRIPDGATITVDGAAGVVSIVEPSDV